MHELPSHDLEDVVGGRHTTNNTQLTQALAQIQSSIKDVASNNTNNGGSNCTTMMLMAVMLMNRPSAPTVVAAASPVVYRPW